MNRRHISTALVAAAALAALSTLNPALAATEGTDYVVLEKPIPNAQGTLIKVFSYDCPFCYKYDKAVTPAVVPKLPKGITFRPFHLKTKGKYGVQGSELFAVLIAKDNAAGMPLTAENSSFKKAKMAFYGAYHDKKERWDAGPEAYLKTGLDAAGMSAAEFAAAKAKPEVQKLLAEWDASYEVAKVQGVPGFVVNGKYLILTKSMASIDGMVETIVELSKK
jgi:protein-disulfide isomerase